MRLVYRLGGVTGLSLLISVSLNILFLIEHYQSSASQESTVRRSELHSYNDSYTTTSPSEASYTTEGFNVTIHAYGDILNSSYTYMLAVVILSSSKGQDRRQAIRETWKKQISSSVCALFIVGLKNVDKETTEKLEQENALYHDMVLLPDTDDSYRTLSHKVLASLIWFDKYINFLYLLKCDDDSFVLPNKIMNELQQRNHSRGLYWGYFIGNSKPFAEGDYAEANWKFCDYYFPYALGGGYVLSADVVHHIAANADAMIVYNNEDVSVGAWTVIYDIERKHDVRFDSGTPSRGCKNNFLLTHKQSIEDMTEKHRLYVKSGKMCKKEHVNYEGEYNWNVPPSKAQL